MLPTRLIKFPVLALAVVNIALGTGPNDKRLPVIDGHDQATINRLITRMEHAKLDELPTIEMQKYQLPGASVDVMRVRMEETYTIQGVGKDTVELRGWIAVLHDHAVSIIPDQAPTWNTAITPTEFVGMHLQGTSKVFGKVEVGLNKDQRVRGRVGALYMPFMQQVVADLSYREARGANPESGPCYVAMPLPIEYRLQARGIPILAQQTIAGDDEVQIQGVVKDVLEGINAKDTKRMMESYTTSSGAFFGPDQSVYTDVTEYAATLSALFASVKTIAATANNDVAVKVVSNDLATVSLTGRNVVEDTLGRKGNSPWRWNLQLEKQKNGWKIIAEHLTFISLKNGVPQPDGTAPEAISTNACKCTASVSVNVQMKDLKMAMVVATPIQWYSEVTTIPPIGETASKSINSSALLSGSRQVGVLLSGDVKFREVVARETLNGSSQPTTPAVALR